MHPRGLEMQKQMPKAMGLDFPMLEADEKNERETVRSSFWIGSYFQASALLLQCKREKKDILADMQSGSVFIGRSSKKRNVDAG